MKIDSFIKARIITFSALFMNFTQKAYIYTLYINIKYTLARFPYFVY